MLWTRGESTWEGQRAEVKRDRDGSDGATSLTGPQRPQAGAGSAGLHVPCEPSDRSLLHQGLVFFTCTEKARVLAHALRSS